MKVVLLNEVLEGFDAPSVDPIYCALVVALVVKFNTKFT